MQFLMTEDWRRRYSNARFPVAHRSPLIAHRSPLTAHRAKQHLIPGV